AWQSNSAGRRCRLRCRRGTVIGRPHSASTVVPPVGTSGVPPMWRTPDTTGSQPGTTSRSGESGSASIGQPSGPTMTRVPSQRRCRTVAYTRTMIGEHLLRINRIHRISLHVHASEVVNYRAYSLIERSMTHSGARHDWGLHGFCEFHHLTEGSSYSSPTSTGPRSTAAARSCLPP